MSVGMMLVEPWPASPEECSKQAEGRMGGESERRTGRPADGRTGDEICPGNESHRMLGDLYRKAPCAI